MSFLLATIGQAARGVATASPAHLEYLKHLLVQALVVFAWWPKDGLLEVLGSGEVPDTLRAAVLIAGFMIAWWSARAGAEEFLFPGQGALLAAPAPDAASPAQQVLALVVSQLVHALHLLALSSPLVAMAFGVSAGEWRALALSVAAILFLAVFYRLLGAVVLSWMGPQGVMTFLTVRILVVLTYGLALAVVPAASHLVLASRALAPGGMPLPGLGPVPGPLAFGALYTLGCALLGLVLARRLAALRAPGVRAGP